LDLLFNQGTLLHRDKGEEALRLCNRADRLIGLVAEVADRIQVGHAFVAKRILRGQACQAPIGKLKRLYSCHLPPLLKPLSLPTASTNRGGHLKQRGRWNPRGYVLVVR